MLGCGRRLGDATRGDRRVGDLRDRQPVPAGESAIEDPSSSLYTDSDVNLDRATGNLRWYYQGVPDDFKDYDIQASPIASDDKGARRPSSGPGKWASFTP